MTYVTIEAEIADGKIVPTEGTRLPERGRALVTLLPEASRHPDWAAVEASLGSLRRLNMDGSQWQREVRAEWNRD
jgi:hypothetical protein